MIIAFLKKCGKNDFLYLNRFIILICSYLYLTLFVMKACLLFFCSLVIPCVLFAQKPPVKFGDVSKEELSMTSYDKDSTASAVILADFGESAIRYRQNTG